MDLVITGFGLLMIMPVWRYILKRSLLDTHRDKLFDLRDDLRDTFAANAWDMSGPTYKQLRDLLNGYLRYTEKFVYSEFAYIENSIKNNPELQETMKRRFEENFNNTPEDQHEYIMNLRNEARRIMMSHMIFSSFPLALWTLMLFPIVGIYIAVRGISEGLTARRLSFFHTVIELNAWLSMFVKIVIAKIAKLVLIEDVVEEYSYRQSLASKSLASPPPI